MRSLLFETYACVHSNYNYEGSNGFCLNFICSVLTVVKCRQSWWRTGEWEKSEVKCEMRASVEKWLDARARVSFIHCIQLSSRKGMDESLIIFEDANICKHLKGLKIWVLQPPIYSNLPFRIHKELGHKSPDSWFVQSLVAEHVSTCLLHLTVIGCGMVFARPLTSGEHSRNMHVQFGKLSNSLYRLRCRSFWK